MARLNLRPARFLAPLCLGALLAPPAAAIDLLEGYRLALQRDALYQAARAEAEAGREALPQARAQLLPSLSGSVARSKNELDRASPNALGKMVDRSDQYYSGNYALTLRQPLFRPYNFALYQQAKSEVATAEATLDKSLQDLLVRLSGAYFEALMARDQEALVQAQKEAYGAQLEAAKRAFAAGQGTRTDIDDAQARYDMTLAQELEAHQNMTYTAEALQAIINQPAGALARLEPARMALTPPLPARVEEWITRGEETNAELKALRANIEAARLEVYKAGAGHLPTVDLVAQRSRSYSDSINLIDVRSFNTSLGFQANIPLFAGGYSNSMVREARANVEKAEQRYEARRREVALQIRKEFQSVAEGVLKVRALEQAERSADQAVFSSQKGFQAGTRTQVDILNAQQQRVNVRRDLAQARYQYIISRVRLQGLVNSLTEEEIAAINTWLVPAAG